MLPLWVDKNLRSHGLIQAYSRTNRILNSVKVYGNIISFRDLEQATNDAIALFGNQDAQGIVVLKPYAEYYATYQNKVRELLDRFPLDKMPIVGEAAQKAFIALFGAILRLRNILASFGFTPIFRHLHSVGKGRPPDGTQIDLHDEMLLSAQRFRHSFGTMDFYRMALLVIDRQKSEEVPIPPGNGSHNS